MSQRKLVAIYARKSRLKDSQALEIERQIELLTDFAEKNNMEYVTFSEEGSSEAWNERPALQEMLKELQRKIYDGVLVTDQDRLTRDRTDFGLFVRFMKNEGLQLFTLSKTYNFMNDDDIFTSGIQSEMDNHFMRMTKRKLRRGRIQAIKKGVFFGNPPFGYTKDEFKHLLPHTTESEIVKDIFRMYVSESMNQQEICDQLTLLGKYTRAGKPFTVRATSLILSNKAYLGVVHYEMDNEEPIYVEDAHPAIIDEETFNQAQILRAEKRVVPQKSQRGIYPLSRLLVCPKCGQTLSFCMKYGNRKGRASLDKESRELYVLNCYSSKGQKARIEVRGEPRCSNNGIKAKRLEDAIINELRISLSKIDEEIEAVLLGENDFISKVEDKQNKFKTRLIDLESQKLKVQDGFKVGIYSEEEALEEIKRIREMQFTLQHELKGLEGASTKAEVERKQQAKKKIQQLLDIDREGTDPLKLNKLLHEVIEKVYYWKEKSDVGGEKPFEIAVVLKA
ncbi:MULTISPECIES: recombinase family protein [unclassified Exiguobacterium]|uniref:recombinase family protein n=1 Tax=unclassified Exiguobacterium TaxID=2644629 RepID=UPI00103C2327|nr:MULTISPECIES: recombinase family protein [unclassified Exiguobacterium]TCI68346.1 recombinase family protein [Exiguobacterium sp. IPCI3]TCI77585.1 recombinase family protein [Exiguobacterium sp. IPCH1]TCI79158.1 recombinase family protein [Exiguobacterium sp. IPBC4]